jgi:flagellar motility protein MotE (MotC chaperone)
MSHGARVRTGALSSLAACFFVSGLLRAGEVIAALPVHNAAGEASAVEQVSAEAGTPTEVANPDLGALAAELHRQRADLARREATLEEREQLLVAIEERLRDRLAELTIARNKLAETAALVDDAAGKDVRHLAEMYGQMKPKQAGQIFNAMAPEFAAGFLGEMEAEPAAMILANMTADKAYAVSLLLAGRNVGREQPAADPAVQSSSTHLP